MTCPHRLDASCTTQVMCTLLRSADTPRPLQDLKSGRDRATIAPKAREKELPALPQRTRSSSICHGAFLAPIALRQEDSVIRSGPFFVAVVAFAARPLVALFARLANLLGDLTNFLEGQALPRDLIVKFAALGTVKPDLPD